MRIRGVYICCRGCTYLFTVNEHVIHVVASRVDAFNVHLQSIPLAPTLPSIRTHHQQHTTTQTNKHKAGGLNDASRCLGPSVSLSYYY
jgi:hypothetical protein